MHSLWNGSFVNIVLNSWQYIYNRDHALLTARHLMAYKFYRAMLSVPPQKL